MSALQGHLASSKRGGSEGLSYVCSVLLPDSPTRRLSPSAWAGVRDGPAKQTLVMDTQE